MKKLTPKQENFCLHYLELGNASEAYRNAGYSKNMSDKTVNEAASRLLKDSKVIARLNELRKPIVEKTMITIEDLIEELEKARKAALGAETVQASAAISATMGKAKLLGFGSEKIDISADFRLADALARAKARMG
jgi:phage terminase small subunit